MKKQFAKILTVLPVMLVLMLTVFVTSPAAKTQLKTPVLKTPYCNATGVRVSWNKVSGAQKYRVFFKIGSSSWRKLADTTKTCYQHKTAYTGKLTYTVRCISKDGKTNTSDFDHKGKTVTVIKAPTAGFTDTSRGTVISWRTRNGASYYRIFIKTNGTWKTLATTNQSKYLHTTAPVNTTGYYKIQCLNSAYKAVSACSTTKSHYHSVVRSSGYTNIMFADDIYRTLGKRTVVPNYPNRALNRCNAATILCKALGYSSRAAYLSLSDTTNAAMKTVTFYGCFYPDEKNRIYPAAIVTNAEYNRMITDASRHKLLSGKTALAFGDSIMYGLGNSGYGDCRMIAEKYGMRFYRYAINGATFSTLDNGRRHISEEITRAAADGRKADVIFLNGATNDVKLCASSSAPDTYDTNSPESSAYVIGFRRSMQLLANYWKNVPVIYIRAHNIESCPDRLETAMGEYGVMIARSYGASAVDVFSSTDFNTSKAAIRERYTVYRSELGRCDGTHPTYLGYTTYYMPLVADQLDSIFRDCLIC